MPGKSMGDFVFPSEWKKTTSPPFHPVKVNYFFFLERQQRLTKRVTDLFHQSLMFKHSLFEVLHKWIPKSKWTINTEV